MYRLPDFLRTAWVSDEARQVWQPRFEAIRELWPRLALQSVAEGRAECAIRVVPARMFFGLQAEARRRGVTAVALGVRGVAVAGYAAEGFRPGAGRPFLYEVGFGSGEVCAELEGLWGQRQFGAAYTIAGVAACCSEALDRDMRLGRVDPAARYAEGGVEVAAGAVMDALWSWLNVERVTCAACEPECDNAAAATARWEGYAGECGYSQEMGWLREVLGWPLEWTALHGIAELKTPVMKGTWTTDTRHTKATLRYRGEGYPAKRGCRGGVSLSAAGAAAGYFFECVSAGDGELDSDWVMWWADDGRATPDSLRE